MCSFLLTGKPEERQLPDSAPYDHIASSHQEQPPAVILGDPIFVNPNSYETVSKVLQNIGSECGVQRYVQDPEKVERQWLLVVGDGAPLSLIIHLIHDALICTLCSERCSSQERLQKHYRERHVEEFLQNRIQFAYEYAWLLPKLGCGHYEMQMAKTFFNVMWDPCLKALCYIMGFESTTALASAKRCANHHKAWQLLLIYTLGTMRELVRPYVQHCIDSKENPSPKEYTDWVHFNQNTNKTYMLHFVMVLRFAMAIVNFRMAVRRNNSSLAWSAKFTFKELIHARNHPKYHQLEIYDTVMYHLAPPEVRDFLDSHTSISRSGDKSLGEDLDFITEEENRKSKKLLPNGVPTDLRWEVVCRNVSNLQELKDEYLKMQGIEKAKPSMFNANLFLLFIFCWLFYWLPLS